MARLATPNDSPPVAAGTSLRGQLRDSLCSLVVQPNGFTAQFQIAETFIGFQGHFPENPVLPGICLAQATMVATEELMELPLRLTRLEAAKFRAPVPPDSTITVVGQMSELPGMKWKVKAKVSIGDKPCATLRLVLARRDQP